MEPKTSKSTLKKRGLFSKIGLAITLLIVLGAFEYRTYEKLISPEIYFGGEFKEDIENTFREETTTTTTATSAR